MSYVPPSWSGGEPPPPPGPPKNRMPSWLSRDRAILLVVFLVLFFAAVVRDVVQLDVVLMTMIVLIPSVILHEISHGWLAEKFGDKTARNAGRITLNPIKHVDPVGTLILPLALSLLQLTPLGYAKPVPVNTFGMSKNKAMFVSLVGPFTNFVLAFVAIIVLIAWYAVAGRPPDLGAEILTRFGVVNVVLGVFNLIPIPPLDGSAIWERFLPQKYMEQYYRFRQYSIWIFLALFLLAGSLLARLFGPFVDLWYWVFLNLGALVL